MQRTDIHIRPPAKLHAALAVEADRLGISLNALVTIALSEWLAQKGLVV